MIVNFEVFYCIGRRLSKSIFLLTNVHEPSWTKPKAYAKIFGWSNKKNKKKKKKQKIMKTKKKKKKNGRNRCYPKA
jgi:hypothetical protein